MAGTATLRGVAGYVLEFTLFATVRAGSWWNCGGDQISAFVAFEIGQSTLRAYVADEFTSRRIPAKSTGKLPKIRFFHFGTPFPQCSWKCQELPQPRG